MALTLYYHPIASFCWKALIALYETNTPFQPLLVDLGDPASRDAFAKLWPPAKFPVLHEFLDFWAKKIEGRLHSVTVAHSRLIKPTEYQAVDGILTLH